MKGMWSLCVSVLAGIVLIAGTALAGPAPALPAIIVSPGLAPEGELVKVLCQRANINVTYEPLAQANEIAKFKSLILIIGGSGKGLGAAGIDVQDELKRAEALLAEAQKLNHFVVGLHLGGEDRRGPASAKFIDVVTPRVNALVVRADGNKDGIFTRIAQEKKIPLTVIQRTPELTDALKKIFSL